MRWLRFGFYTLLLCVALAILLVQEKYLSQGADWEFIVPGRQTRIEAIGDTRYLPAAERKVFAESDLFEGKQPPDPSDWLANHREPGQTFNQFLQTRRNLFQAPRDTLYVQPIGDFSPQASEVLHQVIEYAEVFFDAPVELLEPVDSSAMGVTTRKRSNPKRTQLLTSDILKWLTGDLPPDAYARIAVTMSDLYPDPDWNFVFGQASLRERVGVYSFHRYGEPETPQFLRRCLRVFSHETGHMFAFYHCVHYECLMNGSNHLNESDQAPLFLCPVCLRKLHTANPFDVRKRYERMGHFFGRNGLEKEARWVDRRLGSLGEG